MPDWTVGAISGPTQRPVGGPGSALPHSRRCAEARAAEDTAQHSEIREERSPSRQPAPTPRQRAGVLRTVRGSRRGDRAPRAH
eukprot:15443217-Alexandrium_andersonii.AAC.1